MSTTLRPVITNAGITAVIDAKNRGVTARITQVAVGDGNGPYTATQDMTALKNEIQRVLVAGGELFGSLQNQLHLTATVQDSGDNVPEVYPIFEIGFFLETGELFAVYASPDEKLAEKIAGTDFVLAFDLTLTGVDAGEVVVDGTAQLAMPIARDNLLIGENTLKIHTQAEFDQVFNRGENTEIPANTTIALSPIQHTDEETLANGAAGGLGDDPHNTYNGRPAYILKNSLQAKSNVSIIGFNQEDTVVIKGNADAKINLVGESDAPIRGVTFSGWSFDGRGGVNDLGGNLITPNNGGALFLAFAEQCQLECKIINHNTERSGGGVFGGEGVSRITATHVHQNRANTGGGVVGCNQSTLAVFDCQATTSASGVDLCNDSDIRAFNCAAERCEGGALSRDNGFTAIGIRDSLVANGEARFNGHVGIGNGAPTTPATALDVRGNAHLSGQLTVSGDTTLSSKLTVSGDTQVSGDTAISGQLNVGNGLTIDGEKPFLFKRYLNIPGATTNHPTGKSTAKYFATVVGFRAKNGDIQERDAGEIIRVQLIERNSTWHISVNFRTHKKQETWDIDVMFINRRLVDVGQ